MWVRGPTVGDKIRLGDTDLFVEIEKDLRASYGDEAVFGGGKTLRDGMGFDNTATSGAGCLDLVLTNATIIDAVQGVIKADIGIKDGKIVSGFGAAGNPNTMAGVSPGMACGPATDAINCGSTIVTAGGIDTHVHSICPQIDNTALAGGCTTLVAGGFVRLTVPTTTVTSLACSTLSRCCVRKRLCL